MKSSMQTMLNDILNSVKKMALRTIMLSLRPHIYYTEAFCSSLKLCYSSLCIYTLIYSHLLIHLSLSSFLLLSVPDDIYSFRTFSFHPDSEPSIKLYDTEEFT